MTEELKNWLKDCNMNPSSVSYGLVVGSQIFDPQKVNFKHNRGQRSSTSIDELSSQEKEDLQAGMSSRNMSDEEIPEYFKSKLKSSNGKYPDVKPIPEGEPVFIMNIFKGRTRPLLAFIDSGCNCWVAKEGVPQRELISAKLRDGPIKVGVASGIIVNASAEWASLIPLADGSKQAVRGLTMPNVTQDMPEINMVEVFDAIKKTHKDVKKIQNLNVPKRIGGSVDMIIGIKYQTIYPQLIHQFPNGLAVYRSNLMPAIPGQSACIGGPVGALEGLDDVFNGNPISYLVQLTQVMSDYKPRMEYFPDTLPGIEVDADIPGIEEFMENMKQEATNNIFEYIKQEPTRNIFDENNMKKIVCMECEDDTNDEKKDKQMVAIALTVDGKEEDIIVSSKKKKNIVCMQCGDEQLMSIQGELKRFMQQQEAGLDTSYKCPKCRDCQDCIKGSGYEKISVKQEREQNLIKESIKVNLKDGRVTAELPFKADPKEFLAENSFVAQKRLQNVCRKYYHDKKVKNEILEAFEKLRRKGHI